MQCLCVRGVRGSEVRYVWGSHSGCGQTLGAAYCTDQVHEIGTPVKSQQTRVLGQTALNGPGSLYEGKFETVPPARRQTSKPRVARKLTSSTSMCLHGLRQMNSKPLLRVTPQLRLVWNVLYLPTAGMLRGKTMAMP